MLPGASASATAAGGDVPSSRPSSALAAHRVSFLRCLLVAETPRPAPCFRPRDTSTPPSGGCSSETISLAQTTATEVPCTSEESQVPSDPSVTSPQKQLNGEETSKVKVLQNATGRRLCVGAGGSARRGVIPASPARRVSFKVRASVAARRSRLLDARAACRSSAGSGVIGVAALASRFQELISEGGAGVADESGAEAALLTSATRKANGCVQQRRGGGGGGDGGGRRLTRRSSRASSCSSSTSVAAIAGLLQEPLLSGRAAAAGGVGSAAAAEAMQRVNVRAAIQIFESAAASAPGPTLSMTRCRRPFRPPPPPSSTASSNASSASGTRSGLSVTTRCLRGGTPVRPRSGDVPAVPLVPHIQVETIISDHESRRSTPDANGEEEKAKAKEDVEQKVEGMERSERGQAESPRPLMGSLEPNASFLWRGGTTSTPTPTASPPNPMSSPPRPPPPRPLVPPEEKEEEEGLYDDILAPAISTEDVEYQDIGPPKTASSEQQLPEDIYESCNEENYDDCVPAPPRLPPKPSTKRNCDDVEEAEEALYDDVRALLPMRVAETQSLVSNCYESIGGGSLLLRPASSCDHNNSLYTPGSVRSAPSARTASPASGSDGNDTYAPCSVASGDTSAASGETSEWMDVDVSDTESMRVRLPHLLLQDRSRNRKSPNWSRKVRDQWTKHQSANDAEDVDSCYNMEDHNYETLDDLTGVNHSEPVCADESDSFDSHSSGCESSPNHISECCAFDKDLPEPPANQNIYGISKIAEAAGKKMMELGRSLRRIRTKPVPGIAQQGTEPHTTLKPVSNKQEESVKTSPSSTPKKSRSTCNSSGRKTWTLRKLRQSVSGSSSVSNSTFYLSPAAITGNKDGTVPLLSSTEGSIIQMRWSNEVDNPAINDYSSMKRNNVVSRSSLPNNVIRPSSPPPLPPAFISGSVKQKLDREETHTTWYTESGLFDSNTDSPVKRSPRPNKPNSSNWYAAMGVWNDAAARVPVKDSDPLEGSVTSGKPAEVHERPSHCFQDEPLYQFYIGTLAELAQNDAEGRFDSDGYEEITYKSPKLPNRPTAMELIQPRKGQHHVCTLWSEVPDVVQSQVLSTLSQHDRKLQEAKFEIITSEASYINSLNVLESYFMSSPELNDDSILSKTDRKILFGNVMPVKKCSENFLADLEKCWQENILLHGICDTVLAHASKFLDVYVKYCKNQIYLDRTLRQLKEQNGQFAEVLKRLEGSSKCEHLTLHSFLMLPMQRITRLPLLIDAVHNRLHPEDEEYQSSAFSLATLNKIVYECNEGARHMERLEQIFILSNQLEFPKEVKHVPIMQSSRYLVRCGEVVQLIWREDAKLTFGKKMSKASLYLFLFSDLLVVTKKKSEESFTVLDYCPRNLVQVSCSEEMFRLPIKSIEAGRNLLLLTMLQNHENKMTEMVLSCSGVSDKERWYEALSQPISDNPGETVYEEWDCPQVVALHPYTASQPDELSLEVNDAVNVLRKMTDGWYQGERIRDGERGWFPGNYCVEIVSAHVRARNLKQRYRLLALSGNFLEQQKERVK